MITQAKLEMRTIKFGGLYGFQVGQYDGKGNFKVLLNNWEEYNTENSALLAGLAALNRYRRAINHWIVKHIERRTA